MADKNAWQECEREILDRTNVRAEYEALGLEIVSRQPGDSGWLACRAMGREDRNPSAGICVAGRHKGRYRDHAGEGLSLSLWDFAARFGGRYTDWRDARRYFADRAGVKLPVGREPQGPADRLAFRQPPEGKSDLVAWAGLKGGFDLDAVQACGGLFARYPKGHGGGQPVAAFPVHSGPEWLDGEPCGWAIARTDGQDVEIYQGTGRTPKRTKVASVTGSTSGILGRHALALLRPPGGQPPAVEVIWNVEGLTDLLAITARIREAGLWGRHVAISNSQGCSAAVQPGWLELFRGLTVYVVGDADWPGQKGASRWCAALQAVAGTVKNVELPFPLRDSHGQDLRDFFREGGTYDELLRLAHAAPEHRPGCGAPGSSPPADPPAHLPLTPGGEDSAYLVHAGSICRRHLGRDGAEGIEPLCNFVCRIVEQVRLDKGGGAEASPIVFVIEGELNDGTPLERVKVPAAEFDGLGWVMNQLGGRAIISAGRSVKDHLRAAIQHLSAGFRESRLYAHLGWRKIAGVWCYLHAGGAIGATGEVPGVGVLLSDALKDYRLPAPPAGDALVAAVRASLGMLDLAPDRVIMPVYAAVWLAPLGIADVGVFLHGPTGAQKSEVAALAQQHFGPSMVRENLPANWESTANAVEELAHAAKDALLVVDDFLPKGGRADVERLHRDADRLLRGAGNRSGRQRMRADQTLHQGHPHRCTGMYTGEDVPRGRSAQARVEAVKFRPGDVDLSKLTECQHAAASGSYAAAMSGYLAWLAARKEGLEGQARAEVRAIRDSAPRGDRHSRAASNAAQFEVALRWFLTFAREAGAVSEGEAAALVARLAAALEEAAQAQGQTQSEQDPARRFLRLLAAALASGRAHVEDREGGPPQGVGSPAAWGWQQRAAAGQDAALAAFPLEAQGKCVGWVEGSSLYLQPDASYAAAQSLATEQHDHLPFTALAVRSGLHDQGFLVATEREGRGTFLVRRMIRKVQQDVLALRADALFGAENPGEPPPGDAADAFEVR